MPEKYLTLAELQTAMRISRKTLYKLLEDENFPAFRVGRQWRFKLASVEEYLIKIRREGRYDNTKIKA